MSRKPELQTASAPRLPIVQPISLPRDRTVCVRIWPGRGRPLVLLHGLLDSAEGWDDLARTSARPCHAIDLPGFGGSDLPVTPRIRSYADDVERGIQQLATDGFVLVGHSLGGAVAVELAERMPERVASLVLLAPAGFGRIPLAEAISVPGVRTVVERALPLALANPLVLTAAYMGVVTNRRRPDQQLLQRIMRTALTAMPAARAGTRAVVSAGLAHSGFHRRRVSYDGPVHALWGEHDHLVPQAHIRGLLHGLPQARVEVWQGMGHHPQRERPDELAGWIETASAEDETEVARSAA